MPDRFPGYDVLAKRHTPSWNRQTRQVVDRRLAVPDTPRFLTQEAFATLRALAARILPQPGDRPPIPVASLIDAKLHAGHDDGFRAAGMPRGGDAWRRGLDALDAEAQGAHGMPFHALPPGEQEALIRRMENGALGHEAWGGMPPKTFFAQRVMHDMAQAYYSHPAAWSEIGFGGPASPRGYVRMGFNRRDSWEAAEAQPSRDAAKTRLENRHVR